MLTKNDIKIICDEYSSGRMNTSQLANKFNVSSETIRRKLKDNNIPRRSSRESLKSEINEYYFSKIDSEDKAYWLGFLAADGCLSRSAGAIRMLRLFVAEKDKHIVYDFANDIGYKGKIHYYPKRRQFGISFNSKIMCDDLIGLGILRWKKEDNPVMFVNLPLLYKKHFVRGFFDGDGCISCNSTIKKSTKQYYVNFCANKSWVNTQQVIEDFIVGELGFSRNGIKIRKNYSSIKWGGNQQVEKFGEYLYSNHNRKLRRKYASFLAVKSRDFLNYWHNIYDWQFKYNVRELKRFKTQDEINDIIYRFANIVRHGFEPFKYSKKELIDELYDLEHFRDNIPLDNHIKLWRNIGQKIVFQYQSNVWSVGPSKNKTFDNLFNQFSTCKRAIKALVTTGKKIYPQRLRRELEYAGISRASILPVPVIMEVIKKFDLNGKWFDACAGWGTRLMASFLMNVSYEATDPAVQYYGLLDIKSFMNNNGFDSNNVILHNKRFQDLNFPDADFMFTSPPFYNKEDYGLNEKIGTFDEWYRIFIIRLIEKSKEKNMRVILHVDNKIFNYLKNDFVVDGKPYITGNRSKAPNEWFVEIIE